MPQRLSDCLAAGGIDPDEVTALISPGMIHGTIRVELHYDYKVVSPVAAIVGSSIPLTSGGDQK